MPTSLKAPAFLIVDMQNDFVRAGAPMEVPSARDTLPAIVKLRAAFRAAGAPVLYARYVYDPAYAHLAPQLPWLALCQPPVSACVPGTWRRYDDIPAEREGTAIVDELAPAADEPVIDKPYYSAFHGTGLAARLDGLGVQSLVVAGTMTEMCVEDTARHAVHFGLRTLLQADGVSSNDSAAHASTLAAFARNYGAVKTGNALAAALA